MGVGIAALVAFAFFVPAVNVTFPVLDSLSCILTQGHPCMGGALPVTGSITFWLFGFGGSILSGEYRVNW